MNVAQAMVEAFVQEGIDVATGIAGMSIVEFANAVCSNPAIRVCYARHERGAADIADGYGRVTGQPAVVFADAGPGVANNMAGILNSFGDSTPMIFVASQPDRRTLGWRSYKEFPIHDVFTPVTKWTASIGDPSQVAPTVRRAFTLLRSGRPGPVVIELASDVVAMPVGDFHYEPLGERIRNPGNPAEIERAVGLPGLAQSPYLYAGAGVLMSRAEEELAAHPRQVGPVHDVFTTPEVEVAQAKKIVEAFQQAEAAGAGVILVDGKMVDMPVVSRARKILEANES